MKINLTISKRRIIKRYENDKTRREQVEGSLKVFDLSLLNLQLDCTDFMNVSVKATLQTLYDVGLFDIFNDKDEVFMCPNSFNKRQRGELE